MANELYWHEQSKEDVPAGVEWLSAAEIGHLRRLRIPKRIADWRLGRWTAKLALAHTIEVGRGLAELASIEILPAKTGAPVASIGGRDLSWNISLTHTSGRAACAVSSAEIAVGCDMEAIEEREPAFLADYFTQQEQRAFAAAAPMDRAVLVTLFWSAKESALKLLQEGLRVDTRTVSVVRAEDPVPWSLWSRLWVRVEDDVLFQGWWRADRNFVRTVICEPAMHPPQVLNQRNMARGLDASAFAYTAAD